MVRVGILPPMQAEADPVSAIRKLERVNRLEDLKLPLMQADPDSARRNINWEFRENRENILKLLPLQADPASAIIQIERRNTIQENNLPPMQADPDSAREKKDKRITAKEREAERKDMNQYRNQTPSKTRP